MSEYPAHMIMPCGCVSLSGKVHSTNCLEPQVESLKAELAAARTEIEALRKDKERLDWLEAKGNGTCLIHDDDSRWACDLAGMQPVSDNDGLITDGPISGAWTYLAEKSDWKPSARDAIDAAMRDATPPPQNKIGETEL